MLTPRRTNSTPAAQWLGVWYYIIDKFMSWLHFGIGEWKRCIASRTSRRSLLHPPLPQTTVYAVQISIRWEDLSCGHHHDNHGSRRSGPSRLGDLLRHIATDNQRGRPPPRTILSSAADDAGVSPGSHILCAWITKQHHPPGPY
jgi:hypothetical protein